MKDLERQERLYDLLNERTIYGLSETDQKELEDLLKIFPEWQDDDSFDLTVAAINLSALPANEEMPAHLRARILADSEQYFAAEQKEEKLSPLRSNAAVETVQKSGIFERLFGLNWLGWAIAGAACVALAANLLFFRPQTTETVKNPPTPTPTAVPLSPAQQLDQLRASATDAVTRSWSDFDPKKPRGVQGEVVWSNAQQKGFMRFRGLPVNDKTKESYQVWIFDETQKNPVSAGVFNVNENGEVVIPMNAVLQIQKPTMIGITAEKPGGVMVSDLKNVMAIAKV